MFQFRCNVVLMYTLEMMGKLYIVICIPIIFNDPLKACFFNKKYMYIRIQTQPKKI